MAFTKGEGGGLGLMTPPYTHINNPPPLLSLLPPPIGRYYSIYDSSDRQGLLDAYHDGACCSLSIPFGPQNPPRYHPQTPLPTMCTPPPPKHVPPCRFAPSPPPKLCSSTPLYVTTQAAPPRYMSPNPPSVAPPPMRPPRALNSPPVCAPNAPFVPPSASLPCVPPPTRCDPPPLIYPHRNTLNEYFKDSRNVKKLKDPSKCLPPHRANGSQ